MDLVSKVKGELTGFTNQNHHILTMGGDFHYANATRVRTNLLYNSSFIHKHFYNLK